MVKTYEPRISNFFQLPKVMISFNSQINTDLFLQLHAVYIVIKKDIFTLL